MFRFFRNFRGNRKAGPERTRRLRHPLHFDTLEDRCVPALLVSGGGGWHFLPPPPPQPTAAGLALINSLSTTQVRTTALTDYQRDGYISRNDMLDIFSAGSSGYRSLTAGEFTDLNTLVGNGPTVAMPGYVQYLASTSLHLANAELLASIKANQADGVIESVTLENIDRGSFLAGQVDNWFLGEVHPDDSWTYSNGDVSTYAYYPVNVPLWNGTPVFQDVFQNQVADCWLMSSLAEVALRDPSAIENMITDNGDNTYTVRFYNGGTPEYVTVDNYLPLGGNVYDRPTSTAMWAAVIEKAYVQANGSYMVMSNHQGQDSYQALDFGDPAWALSAITGLTPTDSGVNANSVMDAWYAGSFVVLCSSYSPAGTATSSMVAPNHCYALVNYSSSGFTLFNPWGINGGTAAANGQKYPGEVTETCAALPTDFRSWTQAGGSAAAAVPHAPAISAFAETGAKPGTQVQTPIQVGFRQASTFQSATEPLGFITLEPATTSHHHPAMTFEIKDFSFDIESPRTIGSATSGAGAGKIKEFTIQLGLDKASPAFFKNCSAGTHYSKIIIAMRKAGADANNSGKAFLRYTFGTVFTTKINFSDPGDEGPEETITFVYGKLGVN
jgi:type VI protein secretion system component Hcp